jgi:hypothetical protein
MERRSGSIRNVGARRALRKTLPPPPGVDYRLARRALLRDVRRGFRSRVDVCDAHPELLRAGEFLGTPMKDACPVCDGRDLRAVTYTYEGRNVRKGRARREEDIRALRDGAVAVDCYVVEVCLGCRWNHLIRQFVAGRREAV